jgi:hypothetical protein
MPFATSSPSSTILSNTSCVPGCIRRKSGSGARGWFEWQIVQFSVNSAEPMAIVCGVTPGSCAGGSGAGLQRGQVGGHP